MTRRRSPAIYEVRAVVSSSTRRTAPKTISSAAAGGRGRRGPAAPGCARPACRRPRCSRRPSRGWRHWRASPPSAGSPVPPPAWPRSANSGPSSCIASLATSAAISLMRSRSSAFSMRSVAQELSACCWIALMSRCSLARSSRATRSCSSTAAFSARSFSSAGDLPLFGGGDFVAQFAWPCVRRPHWPGAAGCSRSRARPAACPGWQAALPDR